MMPEPALGVRVFRPDASEDRRQVVALWNRVFPGDPPWNAPDAMIDRKLGAQPELFLVAEIDGRIAGTVLAGFDGVRGWLYHLAVAPEERRRGCGARLVAAAELALRALGCTKVNLQVRAGNAEAVAFYRRLGYEVEERVSMGRRLG
jgi:ribosomal protein S18 acetylase RimI-like enzyme